MYVKHQFNPKVSSTERCASIYKKTYLRVFSVFTMIFQVSLYTAILQNTLLYEFMQCDQQYSNAFGVQELPVCLNSGFCVDLGKFQRKFSQPKCVCSDDFFGPNCEYRVSVLKRGRPIQPEIGSVAEHRRKLVKPDIISTVKAVDEKRVVKTSVLRTSRNIKK